MRGGNGRRALPRAAGGAPVPAQLQRAARSSRWHCWLKNQKNAPDQFVVLTRLLQQLCLTKGKQKCPEFYPGSLNTAGNHQQSLQEIRANVQAYTARCSSDQQQGLDVFPQGSRDAEHCAGLGPCPLSFKLPMPGNLGSPLPLP